MEEDTDAGEAADVPTPPPPRPVLLFLHGAGQTALSFALTAGELLRLATGNGNTNSDAEAAAGPLILCPDLPFHGQTRALPDDADYSAPRLVADVLGCLAACLDDGGDGEQRPRYTLTLVGHSLGGALVVRLAAHPGLAALGELKGACIRLKDSTAGM